MPSRLILGAAQFGQSYGIAATEPVSYEEAARIVTQCRAEGIGFVDTAAAYSDSEVWLGCIGVADLRVISKLPRLPVPCASISGWVDGCLERSLSRLKIPALYAVLLHHAADLFGQHGQEIFQALRDAQSRGIIEKIGVSVYDPETADQAAELYDIDLVQAPLNVFDRRIVETGTASRLKGRGIEIHARSVFLQGVLLMAATLRPPFFSQWERQFSNWSQWCEKEHVDPVAACLSLPLSMPEVDGVLVGVNTVQHLSAIVSAAACLPVVPPKNLGSDDLGLINPAGWPKP